MLKCTKDAATESRTLAINQIKAILVTAPAALPERLEPLPRCPDPSLRGPEARQG
jgi:hypothetical protein